MSDAADRETALPANDRLDSWKEIAAFLQRDVRTVQRWEKHAGLPVHRHAETRLRTAYAYRSELEAWWRAQRDAVEAHEVVPGDSDRGAVLTFAPIEHRPDEIRRPRGPILLAIGVPLILLIGGLLFTGWLRSTRSTTPGTAPRPLSVVLSQFDDQTGDPRVVAAVEATVARQLAGQPGIAPVAPARIATLLRLMRRNPDTPLLDEAARELLLRDGRIGYAITGGVHALPGNYAVHLRAMDADGRTRASVEWHARSADQLVSSSAEAVTKLADALLRLGGGRQPADQLEPVTSSSTGAVRLYTQALQAGLRGQWGAAEQLARRAIVLDPDFAAGQAWVGWTMRQQGRGVRECLPFFERALSHPGAITDRETYLISGMFNAVKGELPGAVASLEALRRLDAGDRQAMDILIEVYWRMGRVRRAADLSVVRAERFPGDFYANVRAAQALAAGKGRPNGAALFAARATKLASPEAVVDRPRWNAWLQVLPVFQRWVAGDARGALDTLTVLDQGLRDRLGRERDAFASAVGFAHLAFGRAKQADDAFRYASAPERQLNLAVLALVQGEEEAARRWLYEVRDSSARRPALFARVGLDREARRGLEDLAPSDHAEGIAAVTQGLLALRQKHIERATRLLRTGLDLLRGSGEPAYFFATEALAAIAHSRGDVDRSIRLLSDAAAEQPHTYSVSQWTAAYWIRMNADLVAQCRRAGRHAEAERVSGGLRRILDVGTSSR